ncbi:MAG: hypothetical protein HY856_13530 [Burkholderiales bacterium]|nr:hypothetical protein [Burkholderiales bacterium]
MSFLEPSLPIIVGLYACLIAMAIYGLWTTHALFAERERANAHFHEGRHWWNQAQELQAALKEARQRLLQQAIRNDKLSQATAHAVERHQKLQAELDLARALAGSGDAAGRRRDDSDSSVEQAAAMAMLSATMHGTAGVATQVSDSGDVRCQAVSANQLYAFPPTACDVTSDSSSPCDSGACTTSD